MTDPADIAAAVDERMAARLAAARERQQRNQADREIRAIRRTAGLRARHLAKLRRLRQESRQRERGPPPTHPGADPPAACSPARY